MKKLSFFLLPFLLIVGCSKEPINYKEALNQRDGVFYTKDTNQPYSGPVFSLDENGRNETESLLKDGKMINFMEITWYDNGQKHLEIKKNKDGKRNGIQTEWYDNGQKKRELTFKDGKPNGLWTYYYENGQKREEKTIKDGKVEGLWTRWYDNGQKQLEETYKNGKYGGILTWSDENGRKGINIEKLSYNDKTSPFSAFSIKDTNKPFSGSTFVLNDEGRIAGTATIEDGEMKSGKLFEYYEDGQMKSQASQNSVGEFDGVNVGWYNNGQKEYEVVHENDTWISTKEWNMDGSLKD